MESVRRRVASRLGWLRNRVERAASTNERNIVIAGPGRSGTTLTCHLLNKLSSTVALAEPLAPNRFEEQMPDHDAVCDELERVVSVGEALLKTEGTYWNFYSRESVEGILDAFR